MELPLLIDELDSLLDSLPNSDSRGVVLGYSGGVDSEVLAFILSEYVKHKPALNVKLVYVHHGLSANADEWQNHCQQQAKKYHLPFITKHVDVKQGARLSLEAEARKVRYQAFIEEMSASSNVLLTAHHQDDQLETLLLALKRGQGPKGVGGMAQAQSFNGNGWQVRPLLGYSKDEVIEFAQRHQLIHIEDESNQDTQFDRNFLRQVIIPQLKSRWPAIAETASRSALLSQQQEMLLDEVTQEKLQQHILSSPYAEHVLNLDSFKTLSLPWQRQILRGFIELNKLVAPSLVQLDQAIEQLTLAKPDAKVELHFSNLLIRRFKNRVFAEKYMHVMPLENIQFEFSNTKKEIELNDGRRLSLNIESNIERGLRLPKEDEVVTIKFGSSGSTICHPDFRHKPRQLKKLWQELEVPTWERNRVPLIYYNEQLVAVVDLWIEKSAISTTEQSLKITLL
ncbi:tRNA lysidine(34) synthetase TilS [Shewanella sp. OPT22]|nr:tRNA lysidine(34) synthetase TilS [Shewanella sp. OPT22]